MEKKKRIAQYYLVLLMRTISKAGKAIVAHSLQALIIHVYIHLKVYAKAEENKKQLISLFLPLLFFFFYLECDGRDT